MMMIRRWAGLPALCLVLTAGTAFAADGFDRSTLTTDSGGTMTCYYRTGPGPVLVLVPGTWGGFWRFEALIDHLPATMPIAVVELTWQGGNVPPSLDISMEQLGDEVLVVLEFKKIDSFVISGHSIGGMIAKEIAGRNVPGLVGAIPMEGWTHHTVVKTAFAGVVTGDLTPDEEAQRQANRKRGRAHLSEAQCDAIAGIWRTWNGYAGLERSTVPILDIWGDRGRPHASRAALQVPDRENIEVAWVPDASHSFLLEAPKVVAGFVEAFMGRFHGPE